MSIVRQRRRVYLVVATIVSALLRLLPVGVIGVAGWPHAAAAPPPYSLRGTIAGALMVSDDQLGHMHFDRPGLLGDLYLAREMLPGLELRGGLHGGSFWASEGRTGGLLALTVGALLQGHGLRMNPYLALDAGAGLTGLLVRPYFLLTVGVDARTTSQLAIGPALGYGRLVQWNDERYSTDAGYVWFGLSLRAQRHDEPPKPKPKPLPRRLPKPEPKPEPPAEPTVDVIRLIERALPNPTQRIELLAPVLFDLDSDALAPIGIAMLHEVHSTLQTRTDILLVRIQGYADERGNAEYNRDLSQRRADRVRDWLIEHGIAPERLTTDPHGAADFVSQAATRQRTPRIAA